MWKLVQVFILLKVQDVKTFHEDTRMKRQANDIPRMARSLSRSFSQQ